MYQGEKKRRKFDAVEGEAEKRQKNISPDEIRRRIKKYSWCRGITHFWQKAGVVVHFNDAYEVKLVCANCPTVRTTRLSSSGALVGNHHSYRHPEDYKTPGHLTTRAEVRRMMFIEGGNIVERVSEKKK